MCRLFGTVYFLEFSTTREFPHVFGGIGQVILALHNTDFVQELVQVICKRKACWNGHHQRNNCHRGTRSPPKLRAEMQTLGKAIVVSPK
jgi:hypothetical protein